MARQGGLHVIPDAKRTAIKVEPEAAKRRG
jgi:hypothetical protein